jgi:hypothetical protein
MIKDKKQEKDILFQSSEENPDLEFSLIKEILKGVEELEQGEKSEYKFGK